MDKSSEQVEVVLVKYNPCSFTEECTLAYLSRIRERYSWKWICRLCVEAVEDEVVRSERNITTEEALNRHINFCKNFQSSGPALEHPISAMGRLIRKSLDSPRVV